jgi:uncharacterized membrane protein
MSDTAHASSGAMLSKHRIEALSDGVFAVVMTLLVLEIKPDMVMNADDEAVRHLLRALVPPVLTFAVAFLISGVFWSLHHRKFALLRHTNNLHSSLTLAFLFAVTLLPVSISIYLHAKSSGLARAVYFANFTLIALSLLVSWLYAQRAGLAETAPPADLRRQLTRRMAAMTGMGVIATVACYFNLPFLIMLALPVVIYLRRRQPAPAPP